MLLGQHAIRKAPLDAPPPTLRCRSVRGPPSGRLAAASIQGRSATLNDRRFLSFDGEKGVTPVNSYGGSFEESGDTLWLKNHLSPIP
jgi:hypothetical protein